ncbi:ABC transporter ATP-binding protein [Desulfitobacterium sp. THU1]|uniref:ABC transporter ATP-binding protein n=1 Tax=Desulfitobacterium sp. THU1 TaxID=3138072 RepID=UPI00311E116C
MTALLSLTDIEKSYRFTSGEGMTALEGINLEINNQEFIAIVGPSGCGKTTLLKLVSGLIQPSKGSITVDGEPLQKSHQHLLGMVFQQPALLPWRKVVDNVLLPSEIRGQNLTQARASAYELLDMVGLKDFIHRKPQELSYGMQQRVSICRALISDPKILVMDEPFASLDAITRFELSHLLLDIWSIKQTTVLFVTHNIQEAVFLADRIIVMTPRPGRIAAIIDVPLPRPRKEEHLYEQDFSTCAKRVHELLGSNAL